MKHVEISHRYLLSYGILYEEELDLQKNLKSLPRRAALELISFALHSHNMRKRSDTRFQSNQLFSWMMQMENSEKLLITEFAQNENVLIGDPSFQFLDRKACLHLIQHILVYSEDDDSELKAKDHSILFKCLLYFNTIVNAEQESVFNWDGSGSSQQFEDYILPIQFKNIDLNTIRDYKVQFLKVYYFFKFCEQDKKYSAHLANFLDSMKIDTYASYLWRVLDQMFLLTLNDEISTKVQIEGDENYMRFFNNLAINRNIQEVHPDLLSIRQFPLFKLGDNQFLYLDYRLFIDKFYQSFLFDFATQAKINIGSLKQHMGEHFSETVLFYKIIENCFNRYGHTRLNGRKLKEILKQSEPDYYIREGSKVFIFEFKDLLINWEVKHSNDLTKIKAALIDKLEKANSGQSKGITQLTNNIINFKKGVYKDLNIDEIDPTKATVYPILVHTDLTLEAYGVNRFINQRFKNILSTAEIPIYQVKKVILINIDTLIQLQDYFTSGTLKLATCINAYIDYTSQNNAISDNFPFDEFIKYYLGKKIGKRPVPPKDFNHIISEFERNARVH